MESSSNKTFLSRQLDPEYSESFKKERHENFLIEKITAREIDFGKTMQFKDVLDEDISDGFNNILVDLSECDSIDASFLGMLVQANKTLKNNNGNLKIMGLNVPSDNFIIFSGFLKFFSVFNSRQSAIQSFSA